jgi:ABC-type glycerol-3-phosphate transport system permease component
MSVNDAIIARRRRFPWRLVVPTIGLALFAVITWYPFVFMLATSVKTRQQFFQSYWWFTFPFDWMNYAEVWPRVSRAIWNSFVYSSLALVLTLFFSLLGGYAFGRFNFRGKDVLFLAILMLLMVPGILTIVPLFVQVRQLGLMNSWAALVLPWTGFEMVFGIYLMRLFFERLPRELFYAARVEGASEWKVLVFVAIPLALPGLGSVAILDLLFTWNDLIWPIVTMSDQSNLPVGPTALLFRGNENVDYGAIFAAYVTISAPLIVIFSLFTRQFLRGIEGI